MKQFQIVYKFSDIVDNIKAKNKKEAERIAQERIDNSGENEILLSTECYEYEVEEVEE